MKMRWISAILAALATVVVGLVLAVGWEVYRFANLGSSFTRLDKSFERELGAALQIKLPSAGMQAAGVHLAELLKPLLGFSPVAICQNDGFDFAAYASPKTRAAFSRIAGSPGLPQELGSFENLGEDAATPDFKITLHFIEEDGTAHARAGFWSAASECQTGSSQCAPIGDVRLERQPSDRVVFVAPNWRRCPFKFRGDSVGLNQ